MTTHRVNYLTDDMTPETIADLLKQGILWNVDEDGTTWVNGRKDEAKLQAIADKLKRDRASEGLAKGIWRRVDSEWLVETDANVGEKVFITRRDGSHATKYVVAIVDGFARVSDHAPKAEVADESQPEAEATVAAAPARKADPEALVMVADDDASIYGSHLLGYEGQMVRRGFRDHGTGTPARRRR